MSISFVIPAYNAEAMLTEAVASVFNGNFEEGDEVIVVNDASTDTTIDVAKHLAMQYVPHVHIINNEENKGCPASRNIGIAHARNELIFNLDADNILAPHSVKKLKNALINERADVAAFEEYRYFKNDPHKITHIWKCESGVFTLADFFSGHINPGPGGNFLYTKKSWGRIGGYWEYGKGLHEAWGFSLKLLMKGAKFFVVPDTFYFHRYAHESLFVRENKKSDAEILITRAFIEPALPLLEEASRNYVIHEPYWYKKLEQKPLYLKDGSRGKNGKIIWNSLFKAIVVTIKNMTRRSLDL